MELFCFAARKTGPTGSDSQPSSQYQRSLLMTVNKRCFPQVMFSSPWLWVSLTCLVWIERREQRKVPSWNLNGYLQQHVFFNLSPGLHSKMTAGRRRVKENLESVAFNRKRKDGRILHLPGRTDVWLSPQISTLKGRCWWFAFIHLSRTSKYEPKPKTDRVQCCCSNDGCDAEGSWSVMSKWFYRLQSDGSNTSANPNLIGK